MTESNVEEMMLYLKNGKKWALYISLVIYTIIFGILLIISFIIKNYLIQSQYRTFFKILLVIYLILISYRLYKYNYGVKNQMPYYGGIYVAYYQCTKCKSLCGGIFGKGPTEKSIIDKECIHQWNAITKDRFDEKYLKSNTDKKRLPIE